MHSLLLWFWLKFFFFFFLEIMVSHMAMSYELQITQMNEELPLKSCLDLTLMQHPRDENLEPWEVHVCLEVEPTQTWYYCIFSNYCTLVILLQVDFASCDEPETICKCYYKIKNFYFRMLFNFWRWTISLVARSNSLTAS
jgi:hypothetical protein